MRFKLEVAKILEKIEWWNWSEDKMKENQAFFGTRLNEESSPEVLMGYIGDKKNDNIS
jgi:hypothetical protein